MTRRQTVAPNMRLLSSVASWGFCSSQWFSEVSFSNAQEGSMEYWSLYLFGVCVALIIVVLAVKLWSINKRGQ